MNENNKTNNLVNRVSKHPNRRKLTIVSQSPNEIIVDVERADSATVEGSTITADTLNDFQTEINTSNSNASSALSTANSANTIAQTASTTANSANQTANSADTKATTALSNSTNAISTANEAKEKALEVESKLADRGTTIKINGVSQIEVNFTSDPQTQITNEATARVNTDNNLQSQITNESTTRQNTDSSLQTQITNIQNNITKITNSNGGFAAGSNANSNATNAIQLGSGTNSKANTFQVFNFPLLDSNGSINSARLESFKNSILTGNVGCAETVEGSSFGDKGYIKYKSGLKLCWGVVGQNDNYNLDQTFYEAFSTKCYGIVITACTTDSTRYNHYANPNASEIKTTGFKIRVGSGGDKERLFYLAIGK